MAKPKQTDNRRRNGKFAPGNKLGNRFKPGESGNSEGRPKRTKLTEALTAKMAEIAPGAVEETIAERIAQALIDEALNGNVQAIREVGDRTEGKPRATLDADLKIESESRTITPQYRAWGVETLRELLEAADAGGVPAERVYEDFQAIDPELASELLDGVEG